MDMEHEIPKKLAVLATHGDGEPPKTLEARYVENIMYFFNNPEKAPFNYIMGYTLDQREYFRDYRLTQKGKLLWDQIHLLKWYAWELCKRYGVTCCSRMKTPHLPFSCEFNDHRTLASYANGIYDYNDLDQIEEFVAFMGDYEIEALFKRCDDNDDAPYRSENLAMLRYCYTNYEYNAHIERFKEKSYAAQEETIILQETMEEENAEIVSSLDEKDEEESEEQKEEERTSYPCPPSNESNSSTHTLFNFPSFLSKDECYDPLDSFEISLFDELDACYACGHDANMNDAYVDELAIVPYVTHDDFDEYNMHVLAAPTCNYYERGTTSPPLYVSNTIKLQETAYAMYWALLDVHELFFSFCSSIGPINFCSSALYSAYFCCLGDHVLELCMLILAGPK